MCLAGGKGTVLKLTLHLTNSLLGVLEDVVSLAERVVEVAVEQVLLVEEVDVEVETMPIARSSTLKKRLRFSPTVDRTARQGYFDLLRRWRIGVCSFVLL
jgi:hypothetical protein